MNAQPTLIMWFDAEDVEVAAEGMWDHRVRRDLELYGRRFVAHEAWRDVSEDVRRFVRGDARAVLLALGMREL
jgi:hypothetical protein